MIKKFIISLICAAAFICTAAAVSAEELYIEFDAETGTIKNVYNPPMDVYEIPSEIDGVTVRKLIVDRGYENELNYVKKLIIPETIEEIDWWCSIYDAKIEIVEINENNPYLKIVDGVLFSKDMKTLCCALLPLSGEYTIPDGVQTLKNNAFHFNMDLKMIKIPDSVSVIEGGAISYYAGAITVSENNPSFCLVDGILFSKDMKQLVYFPYNKTGAYTVPDSVEKICDEAFDHTNLSQLTLNNNLKEIGKWAFSGLWRVKGIRIPDSVTTLNDRAFFLSQFEWIVLPSSISSINASMLRDISYSNIYIPDSVTAIVTDESFNLETYFTYSRFTIYTPSDSAAHKFAVENNLKFVLTDGITADEAAKNFSEKSLQPSFFIDDDGVVSSASNIHSKELVIPEKVDSQKVAAVYLNEFYTVDYENIEKLVIPDNVLIVPFSINADYDIEISDNHKYYTKKDNIIYSKDMTTLIFCIKDIRENFTVPDNVEHIYDKPFFMLKNLKKIKLSKSVKIIEPFAFANCHDLEVIDTSDNENFVFEDGVLFSSDRKKLIWCSTKKTGTYTIPGTVTEIYPGAFRHNALSDITVPDNEATGEINGVVMRFVRI